MNPVQTYLQELRDIHFSGVGVPETSYYGALANLLNEIGRTLKPKVRCIINLKNRGAGIPDGGLFTADQFPKASAGEPQPGQIPARGAIEVKPTSDDAWVTAESQQVSGYWRKYGQVLVTNYRDFVLVGQDADGKPVKLETYRLARSEAEFWTATAHPMKIAEALGEPFIEYLKRVMLHAAPLAAPQELAWFLASYARDAKARIERAELPALDAVRNALEEALGLKFEGGKGEHFFRSTLVQTLFYGIFSAWVLWSKGRPTTAKDRFNWHETAWYLRVPMIRALFEQVATPSKLGPLGLEEVLNWATAALNRVDRGSFFERFEEDHAVQYFYEPFLQAFDPELRKDLGVWYTPPEIVQYMVARVDTVLREELDIEDGLADPRVYVLDPCCGTGTYLVEVLKRIATTLREKGGDALAAYDLKRAAMNRVFGFEILPAPFVVAHLQLGLLLQNRGAPLSEDNHERAGVYLTNALTGWEPPDPGKERIVQLRLAGMPELKEERTSAEEVKREKPILVVIGNPPYNAFAGVSPVEEQGLVEPYKQGLISRWGIKKFNLDDLYVRFFRLAERRIAEMSGQGVVCYISNFSYLGDPSYVVMRQRLLSGFDALWFDCMNGDSRETGKLTPEGKPDPSVFSTAHNKEGIRVGTAISLLVRKTKRSSEPLVRFRQFWGVEKRTDLLESLKSKYVDGEYKLADPEKTNRFSFHPSALVSNYLQWPKLVELSAVPPCNGLMEKRRGALIDIDREDLQNRMQMYYDPSVDWEALQGLGTGLTENAAGFEASKVRPKVQALEQFRPERICRYALRPFETRWCFYSGVSPLWNRSRPTLWAQCWEGNGFLLTRPAGVAAPEGVPLFFTGILGDNDSLRGHSYYFPLWLRAAKPLNRADAQMTLIADSNAPSANLSGSARTYLSSLGIADLDASPERGELIWMHALAIGYSPAFLGENADGIRQDWPHIPLPDSKEALLDSAALGRQVALILDTESQVSGVTTGSIRSELKFLARASRAGGGSLNPDAGELAVTAGWGHPGKDGITMPGKGRMAERDYTSEELSAIEEGARSAGMTPRDALVQLGETTLDVYLNQTAYWSNVPVNVWNYTIGGYQVMKKWLSYREADLLGRSLTIEEVREVANMARRIAAILLLQPQLDANYQRVKESTYPWPQSEAMPKEF